MSFKYVHVFVVGFFLRDKLFFYDIPAVTLKTLLFISVYCRALQMKVISL